MKKEKEIKKTYAFSPGGKDYEDENVEELNCGAGAVDGDDQGAIRMNERETVKRPHEAI